MAPLDSDTIEALAGIRILDSVTWSEAQPLSVRAVHDAGIQRAMERAFESRRPTEGWVGVAYTGKPDEQPQVFLATDRTDEDTYPFSVRYAAGRYLRLKIAEHQKLALTVKLIWSTLWMKSGNSAPPHRILVDCREDPLTLLIPAR